MEKCSICNSDYKKAFKSDHVKSVKHLEKVNQNYCKKCNTIMTLSDKTNHLNSDEHKNKTKQQQIWCEDCGKYISDKTRHLRSEIHTLRRNSQNAPAFAFANTASLQETEVIVSEKTYIKLKVNPTHHLEEEIISFPDPNFFPTSSN